MSQLLKTSMINLDTQHLTITDDLKPIADKILHLQRITPEEGLLLWQQAEPGLLGMLANHVRENKNGNVAYFNRNIHIEPTNICVNNCRFCSFSKKEGEEGWEFTVDEMLDKVKKAEPSITEVHIVGGVHPDRDLHYYGHLIKEIKKIRPDVHVKAFTAVELDFMIKKAGYSTEEGLKKLKAYGLDSIPGGGAEIFDEEIRKQICSRKNTSEQWLAIHETAHRLGIPSNATILYGHIENYSHRIDHLNRLRKLQDKTGGFNAFIPLKYRNKNNEMSQISEVSAIEDMKNFAMTRIFLDNIPHIKAYWPAIGKPMAQLALSFGVDDLDGTINDSTKIYALAGAEDKHPDMNTEEIIELIKQVNRTPVERDSVYQVIKEY
jgi:aminodeoxyfutalosine synthase